MTPSRAALPALLGLAAFVLFADAVLAAEQPDNSLDRVVELYRLHAHEWEASLRRAARALFMILVAIELAWSAFRLAFKGADLDEWLSELLSHILIIGFFAMLLDFSSDWASAIVKSFRQAADDASAAAGGQRLLHPSNVFDTGLMIVKKVMGKASMWKPGSAMGLALAAIIIVVCFALITAFMILALVESYVVISAGVLMMGFGGARWTRDYAVKTFVYAVSVGAKLFVMQLLVGLSQQLFRDWLRHFETGGADIFVVIGAAVVMVALVKVIPDIVQGVINGASTAPGGALVEAGAGVARGGARTLRTVARGAAGAHGAARAAGAAGGLANEQYAQAAAAGEAPRSAAGRRAWKARRAAGNLGSAFWSAIGARVSGRASRRGTLGHRMARDLRDRREKLAGDAKKNVIEPEGGA